MLRSTSLLTVIVCAGCATGPFAAPSLAGDLSQLTEQQKSDGVGQLQSGPSPPPDDDDDDNRRRRDRCNDSTSSWFGGSSRSAKVSNYDSVFGSILGTGAAVAGTASYQSKEAPAYLTIWDEDSVPLWEAQFNTTWMFESRTNQSLIVGNTWGEAKRFDWTGAPGFETRLTFQPLSRLGAELLFDYTAYDESFSIFDATDFATYPHISFTPGTVRIERNATFASGQVNALLRDSLLSYGLIGLRWWHQDDLLSMQRLPNGAAWFTETQTNSPFIQLGINSGFIAGRLLWTHRFGGGVGAAFTKINTGTSQVVGVPEVDSIDQVKFAAFFEMKGELAYAITERLSVRAGANLLGMSHTFRAAPQIRTTDLASGQASANSNPLLLSSLFTGLSYQY